MNALKPKKKNSILLSLEMQQWKQNKYDVSHVFQKGIYKKINNAFVTSTMVMKMHTIHSEGCVKFIAVLEIGRLHTWCRTLAAYV